MRVHPDDQNYCSDGCSMVSYMCDNSDSQDIALKTLTYISEQELQEREV